MKREIITLSNGKKVGNFSSPHPFTFTDGSILPAVSDTHSEWLKVNFHEDTLNKKGDLQLKFTLSPQVITEMKIWDERYYRGEVDVVFCCLPMMTALYELCGKAQILDWPFRAIRMEDRIKKLISIDKQCI